MTQELEIRECVSLEELKECVQVQREVFSLPQIELSPVRHFVVTRNAGGWALGAWDGDRLAGFVLSVPAFLRGKRAFYSHMTGIRSEYQSHGLGAKLKWAQRERALREGVNFIKWTFEPVKARNAYFNLEKLGATVSEYRVNFYGTDYGADENVRHEIGLASDRLFAEWELNSPKVEALAAGHEWHEDEVPRTRIEIMNDWVALAAADRAAASKEQKRIRGEFQAGFDAGLIARTFRRDDDHPAYFLYAKA
ncbi:MAG: GNAT family N-acetyltransferase [Acidobacteria bacterium]|nr:GNAT family N-acetyltransferase [Acidobacteriota bacterium]